MARNFPDLRDITLEHIYQITSDRDATLNWCRDNGLLAAEMFCEGGNCLGGGNRMFLKNRPQKSDGQIWRCSVRRVCNKQISIRNGSFFARSHLPIGTILKFMYFWVYKIDSWEFVKRELDIGGEHTYVDWCQFFRDICAEFLLAHPVLIGVEIDESLFVRRKYQVGRVVREQWVFGGYDPQTREGFLVTVDRRDAATLLPLIQRFILPGTTIISDMWGAYNQIQNLGYQHLQVNHRFNFVNPVNHATTNHVESMWQKAKEENKRRYGTATHHIPEYLSEFMYRQRFRDNKFGNFVSHIREVYPEAAM